MLILNFSLVYVYEQYARIPAYPVNWGYILCQLYPSWVVSLQPTNICPECVSKPSDGKSPVLNVWGMWSTSSFPLVPGLLWLKVVVDVSVAGWNRSI